MTIEIRPQSKTREQYTRWMAGLIRSRYYLIDADTREDLGQGIASAMGAYVGEDKTTADSVTLIPIKDTPADIGDLAYQGDYGFSPYHRTITAAHFPGRTVLVKDWHPAGSSYRRLA